MRLYEVQCCFEVKAMILRQDYIIKKEEETGIRRGEQKGMGGK